MLSKEETATDSVVGQVTSPIVPLSPFEQAVERILGSEPSKYLPKASQEHERTKQVHRAHKKFKGGSSGTV